MSDWIKVIESLPEEDQEVFYYFKSVGVHKGKYNKINGEYPGNCFSGLDGFLTDDVTHWMPVKGEICDCRGMIGNVCQYCNGDWENVIVIPNAPNEGRRE